MLETRSKDEQGLVGADLVRVDLPSQMYPSPGVVPEDRAHPETQLDTPDCRSHTSL